MSRIGDFFGKVKQKRQDDVWIFTSMLIGAICSLIASFVLSVEAVILAGDPEAVLACSVNVVLNCATVALHPTADFMGFPNSFLGLIAEPVVITVAIAGLAGVKFPRAFMATAQFFYTVGFLFALYLLGVSYFVIGALCPWCLLVTLTTTLVWFSITRYNIRENNLYLSKDTHKKLLGFVKKDYDKVVMVGLIVFIIAAIIVKYGPYLFG